MTRPVPIHRRWQLWIDTGGTFTDCVAVDPKDGLHATKVLSTSAIRGTVEDVIGPRSLRVRLPCDVPAGVVRGLWLRLLESDPRREGHRAAAATEVAVTGCRPAAGPRRRSRRGPRGAERLPSRTTTVEAMAEVQLASPLAQVVAPGVPFEVRSDEPAAILAARLVTGTPQGKRLPPIALRLGTTLGTNALLERRGAAVALFITKGFGDLLRIGTQQRPDLFTLDIRRPPPLYRSVVEVHERVAADGSVVQPVAVAALRATARELLNDGISAAATALLNSHRNGAHEREVAQVLRSVGFTHVVPSADLAPRLGFLARAETAVVEATVGPVILDLVQRVRSAMATGAGLHLMTSAGGLVRAESFRAKDGLLSGPAAGVVGAVQAAARSGFARILAFDMGGTSTDVARFDGDHEYRFEHEVGDAHLFAPALAIETVAAGGGSICALEGDRLRVGPRSAGARPGPACYGAGGPLTLTDVNLLLGRLDPARFAVPVDPTPARRALEALRSALAERTGERPATRKLLEGLLAIANERMAEAIRQVSTRRGYDPADHALVAFGGAGGQHACGVAARLGIETVLIPADPGLLSAWGLGGAAIERFAERQVLAPLAEVSGQLEGWFAELAADAAAGLAEEGAAAGDVEIRRRIATLRLAGQDTSLAVDHACGIALETTFAERYAAVYGHAPEARPIEVESLRVVASSRTAAGPAVGLAGPSQPAARSPSGRRRRSRIEPAGTMQSGVGRNRQAAVYERARLRPGSAVQGPALILEPHSSTVVEETWRAEVDAAGALVLRRSDPGRSGAAAARRRSRPAATRTGRGESPGAVRLELFTNRLRSIAVEMGEMLKRTALSTNVKERLDFSCAILDAGGGLVVNAPHVPVHLGGLGLCVREVARVLPLAPGDVAVTNHPVFGGTHLPDVTVITPVHDADRLLGYAASRAHHAEIGGARPGSMSPLATCLAEEGVVIPPTYLIREGRPRFDAVREILIGQPFPSRAVEENLADLRAAVAANRRGAEALRSLAAAIGPAALERGMEDVAARAARLLGEALARSPARPYDALERLDDGSPLAVRIAVEGGRAVIDFAGSAGVHPRNLNATPAVVRSVVLYALRLLVGEPLPLNEGLLRPVELSIPSGILNPPFPEDPARAPAVGGGNVETSQRLVDTILKALGLAACSQGTMNNVLFGNERFGYYETVGGGAGAGPGFDGASGVHTHMTNTRITDPEVLEHRTPVRVERFELRSGSGGAGRHRGGDGLVRELRFLAPLSLSVLGQHRIERPYGLAGGEPGHPGSQHIVRASGEIVELAPLDACEVGPNDRLVLETPGGGGYGPRRDPPGREAWRLTDGPPPPASSRASADPTRRIDP